MKPPCRITKLESWVRGVEEAMISATDHAAAAERERDEYKHRCKVSDGACAIAEQQREHWMQRAKVAEAEIARRDAAASEPVAWQFYDAGAWHNGSNHNNHRENTQKAGYRIRELCVMGAQPAVLPPAIGEVRLGEYRDDGTRPATVVCLHDQADWENFADGTKLYLGAQPQKPVVLVGDAVVYEHVKNGLAQYGTLPNGVKVTAEFAAGFNYRGEVDKIALDAANVKWELNK